MNRAVRLALLAAAVWLPAAGPADCDTCVQIRVGVPHVARGPAIDIADNHFTEIALPDGRFRGFDAHSQTRAIDGSRPSDMGGPARVVLAPGAPGSYDSCGQWLNHAELAGGAVLGFIHAETACHYDANGQTHMSTALAMSKDYGLTWQSYGQILTGTDAPAANRQTGEGSCSTVDGKDGFYYAYCYRNRDQSLIVARGPVADPRPGTWKKFFQGQWDQPGLGGDATGLGNGSGAAVARWTATGQTVLLGWRAGGLGLRLSTNHTDFTALAEPLLALDPGVWRRPDPAELVAYPVLLDARTGGNQLSDAWMLAYAYWPPYGARDQKYLVFRDIRVTRGGQPGAPQVGVALARWYDGAQHVRWSTTGPVPGDGVAFKLETTSGYLMTAAPAAQPSVALEDCVSQPAGHADHVLAEPAFCRAHGYQRLRTAGWVFALQQPNTVALYLCYDAHGPAHFASTAADCEKLGTMERRLGYALSP